MVASTVSRLWLHLIKYCLLHNVKKKYRNKKIIKKKGDVGMVCQKVHKQGRIRVMVTIQSPVPTSLLFVKRCRHRCRKHFHFFLGGGGGGGGAT